MLLRIARSMGRQPMAWVAVLGAAAFASCATKAEEPPTAPPPQVSVVELRAEDVLLTIELPGRTAPFMVAEVRPQVGGLIQARSFREGSNVKVGDLLYQIEPATFQANVAIAEAALGNAQASLVGARLRVRCDERRPRRPAAHARASLGALNHDLVGERSARQSRRLDLLRLRSSPSRDGSRGLRRSLRRLGSNHS